MELTIEKIQECKKVKEFLDDVCEKYFKTDAPDGIYYGGWKFSDYYPNCIAIHYAYFLGDEYKTGDDVISMDVLIDFSKRYKNNE